MLKPLLSLSGLVVSCSGHVLLGSCSARAPVVVTRAAVCALEPAPPAGFVWADADEDSLTDATPPSSPSVPASSSSVTAEKVTPKEQEKGVVTPKEQEKGVVTPIKRKISDQGLFAPLVLGAKRIMGEQELKELRANVIGKHSKVITNFVDTSESKFGQLVLQRMFDYADKDGNGTLDKEEVRSALNDLGFDFIVDKQLDTIIAKADVDDNEVIDFEEFVKATPRALRTNLVKLAKKNGHDLGFLV